MVVKMMFYRKVVIAVTIGMVILTSCTISYKFNGASIDYTKTKTITISNFPNNAQTVYPPLEQDFNNALKDIFTKRTRLSPVSRNGDLQLEGEITDYNITSLGARADGLAPQTQLTMTVKVRFTNTKNEKESFESSFSSPQTFDSSQMLTDALKDALDTEMIKDITEQIYNQCVAKW